jgi:uncharacterized LabA/DUF88 family protein
LAIDVVIMAHRDLYDVGIIVSCDTDLRPAIEAVLFDTDKHVETAAWKPDRGNYQTLSVPGKNIWCNLLPRERFDRCSDATDYTVPTEKVE